MNKREQGVLTVEASIVLSFCTLILVFLLSFARVYTAQSMVSHAVLQASDAVAMESYLRETVHNGGEDDVVKMANRFNGVTSVSADTFTSLRTADIQKISKEKFTYAISGSVAEADEKLKGVGVKDGLDGCNFAGTHIDLGNDDVIVHLNYTIKLQFPVFGWREIEVSKTAKSKTFGDILFGIETIPEDPKMGSASGGGQYKHGTSVQISATPNYGYEFVGWDDGSTANPRTVTVTGAHTYVAKFAAKDFGVILEYPNGGGSATGGGTFKYLGKTTVAAIPAEGYQFVKWVVYKHEDKSTTEITEKSFPITVDQTYTCRAYFKVNKYTIAVNAQGVSSDNVFVVANNQKYKSVSLDYNSRFTLKATNLSGSGYVFKGWVKSGETKPFSANYEVPLTVPAKDMTYTAVYEVKPSIKITGGSTGGNSTQLTAKTVPSGQKVKWSSSNPSVFTVDSNGKITAKKAGTATVTATMTYNDKDYSISSSITVKETTYNLGYCMNMSTKATNNMRYYTKYHISLVNKSNWGAYFTGTNHHCHELHDHARKTNVKYTELYNGRRQIANGEYVGNSVIRYGGWNKSGETGYVFNNGTGNAMYFILSQNGPDEGVYFSKIKHN